jgi:hypothetical protein
LIATWPRACAADGWLLTIGSALSNRFGGWRRKDYAIHTGFLRELFVLAGNHSKQKR